MQERSEVSERWLIISYLKSPSNRLPCLQLPSPHLSQTQSLCNSNLTVSLPWGNLAIISRLLAGESWLSGTNLKPSSLHERWGFSIPTWYRKPGLTRGWRAPALCVPRQRASHVLPAFPPGWPFSPLETHLPSKAGPALSNTCLTAPASPPGRPLAQHLSLCANDLFAFSPSLWAS